MQEILVFLAYIAAIAVCISIAVCALAFPVVKAIRFWRGH
ncbi:hypothetical protein DFP87_12514 [Achromobacter marplatensis]|uniref:Uncharacterized protein n=1 Tax=Achromobacter marplatensis TaxID=470868 RepID=A0ABX9FYR4_9BURK|nr:hypothetical protein DFP87_12514 [Achromobacter marplatensis]CAB3712981.1 hypothetical protein LMG26219_06035 [Achromobacter marplatensis]